MTVDGRAGDAELGGELLGFDRGHRPDPRHHLPHRRFQLVASARVLVLGLVVGVASR